MKRWLNLLRARPKVQHPPAVHPAPTPAPTRPKVFGIGLPRTGTTTLGACLETLGYRHASFDFQALVAQADGDLAPMRRLAAECDAFEDAPWFMRYREFDALYPDARFVLTLRHDADTWLRSGIGHDARQNLPGSPGATAKGLFIAHYRQQGVDADDGAAIYRFHNLQVQDHFADRPGKLLTVCWEDGDGWDRLCAFLALPVPAGQRFPHENASPPDMPDADAVTAGPPT